MKTNRRIQAMQVTIAMMGALGPQWLNRPMPPIKHAGVITASDEKAITKAEQKRLRKQQANLKKQ
jgi:hypothetical protein